MNIAKEEAKKIFEGIKKRCHDKIEKKIPLQVDVYESIMDALDFSISILSSRGWHEEAAANEQLKKEIKEYFESQEPEAVFFGEVPPTNC